MVNSWSLLYDEIYGDDKMSPCKTDHIDDDFLVGLSTASADTNVFTVDTSNFDNVSINTNIFNRGCINIESITRICR